MEQEQQQAAAAETPPQFGAAAVSIGQVTQLPASPIAPPDESQHVAKAVLEAEQWLESAGWRPIVNLLSARDTPTWCRGVEALRAWHTAAERHVRRVRWRAWLAGAFAGALVTFGVGAIAIRILVGG